MTPSITIHCHYAQCHILYIVLLNVIMLSAVRAIVTLVPVVSLATLGNVILVFVGDSRANLGH
jgi:hypothetical protein